MAFSNIKIKKSRILPTLKKTHFWRNHRGGKINPSAFLGLRTAFL